MKKHKKRIVIFGGTFNPPGMHHRKIAEGLVKEFDLVVVYPCDSRSDKPQINEVPSFHRKEMIKLNFEGLENLEMDFYDLDNNVFTPTYILNWLFEEKFKDSEIWHAVGGDLIFGGRNENSQIQRVWKKGKKIWQNLNFAAIECSYYPLDKRDIPPRSVIIRVHDIHTRSTIIRRYIKHGESLNGLVMPKVKEYINKNNLYG